MEDPRDQLQAGAVFDDADECHCRWRPTRRALWSPRGQHVRMPTPRPPGTRSGVGAVHEHPGDTVVLCRRRQRRREGAARLQALVDKPPTGTISVAGDHAETPADDAVEAVVRAAAGRVVWRYLPTESPGLNPLERRWRQCRREVTHGERLASRDALLKAAHAFSDRDNQCAERVFSIIGVHAA